MAFKKFINSPEFLGNVAYPTERIKPWHGFLYLAKVNNTRDIKVGYTHYDINRREGELKSDEIDAIFYLWSSPNPHVIEKYVKQLLRQFAKKEGGQYKYEIFKNIPWDIMVLTIRLITLWVHLRERWLIAKPQYEVLKKYFGGVSFNTIRYKNRDYKGSDVPEENGYPIGTRVDALYDGQWYPAKIVQYLPNMVASSTKKGEERAFINGYKLEWTEGESKGTTTNLDEKFVRPVYGEIDIRRVLTLEDVYTKLSIDNEKVPRLKL